MTLPPPGPARESQRCSLALLEASQSTMSRLLLALLAPAAALRQAPRPFAATRRQIFDGAAASSMAALLAPVAARAELAPGFAIVDKVAIDSNPEASKSRDPMNGNVLFGQDFYFKYGRSAPFLQSAETPLPDNGAMPFTRIQQRYEAYQKYAPRVEGLIDAYKGVEGQIKAGKWSAVDAAAPAFPLRALGLLANGLMASENTSPSNVLFLTRWYINEVYLDLGDVAKAKDQAAALAAFKRGRNALNSALIILNKEISPKVGAQFATL